MRASAALAVALVAAACAACAASSTGRPEARPATAPTISRPWSATAADRHAARRQPATPGRHAAASSKLADAEVQPGRLTTAVRDILFVRHAEKYEAADVTKRIEEDTNRLPSTAEVPSAVLLPASPSHQSNDATEAPVFSQHASVNSLETVSRHGEEFPIKIGAWNSLSDLSTSRGWVRFGFGHWKTTPKPESKNADLTEVTPTSSLPFHVTSHSSSSHPTRGAAATAMKSVQPLTQGPAVTIPASSVPPTRGASTVATTHTRDAQPHLRTKSPLSTSSTLTSVVETMRSKPTSLDGSYAGDSSSTNSLQPHKENEYTFGTSPLPMSDEWAANQSMLSSWKGAHTTTEVLLAKDTPSTLPNNKLVFELSPTPSVGTTHENDNTEAHTEFTGKRRHATSSYLAPSEALKPARKAIVITFPKLNKNLPIKAANDSDVKQHDAHLERGAALSQVKLPLEREVSTLVADVTGKFSSPVSPLYVEQQTAKLESETTMAQSFASSTEIVRLGEDNSEPVTSAVDGKQGEEGKAREGKQLILTVLVSYLKEGHSLVNETITFNLDRRDNSTDNTQITLDHISTEWTETSRAIASALSQLPSLQRVLKGFVLATPAAKQDSATPFPPTLSLRPSPLSTTENMLPFISPSERGNEKILITPSPSNEDLDEDPLVYSTRSRGPGLPTDVLVEEKAEETKVTAPFAQTHPDYKYETAIDYVPNVNGNTDINYDNRTKKIVLYVDTGDCVPEIAEKISRLENRSNSDSGKQIVIEMNCYQPDYTNSEQMNSNNSDKNDIPDAETGDIQLTRAIETHLSSTRPMKSLSTVKPPEFLTLPTKRRSFAHQSTQTDLPTDMKSTSISVGLRRSMAVTTSPKRRQPLQIKQKIDSSDSTPRPDAKLLEDSKRKWTRSRARKTSGSQETTKKTAQTDAGKHTLMSTTPGSEATRETRVAKPESTKANTEGFVRPDEEDQIGMRMDVGGPISTTSRARENTPTNGRTYLKQKAKKSINVKDTPKARGVTMTIKIRARKKENDTDDKYVKMALVPSRLPETLALSGADKIQSKTSPRNEFTASQLFNSSQDNLILENADAAPRIDELSIDPSQISLAKTSTIPPWGFLKLFSLLEGFELGNLPANQNRMKSAIMPITLSTETASTPSSVSLSTTTTSNTTSPTTAITASFEQPNDGDNAQSLETEILADTQQASDVLVSQMPKVNNSSADESKLSPEGDSSVTNAAAQLSLTTASSTASSSEAPRTARPRSLLSEPKLRANKSRGYRPKPADDPRLLSRGRIRLTTSRTGTAFTQGDACENLCRPRYRTVCAQVGSITRTFNSLCDVKVEGCVVGENPKILHTGSCNRFRKKKTKVTIEQEEEVPENELVEEASYTFKPPVSTTFSPRRWIFDSVNSTLPV
ncbi:hypothetical protein FOCC_FOCC003514 [Frankliniella occidentalis]|uniref:Uncharacterized protein LOC113218318 n=1 Tax=Frankliniella occidentalis TaxID=133901 RepID=A0A6J1TUW4_FRAOC|nr:uncharacterized protein LOC113218318 [Frankliniella occidentalis]KAE8749775.1 hypothetical protein FOCC_FOCC003514 [Frankliniella occidentalis]